MTKIINFFKVLVITLCSILILTFLFILIYSKIGNSKIQADNANSNNGNENIATAEFEVVIADYESTETVLPFALGEVSFVTDSIWIISNDTITQIWSDAVTATGCNKATFNGGDRQYLNYYIDCRLNPKQKGDLFSWRAVSEFKNELCPYPWRVPTTDDFKALHLALGGADFDMGVLGKYMYFDTVVHNRYLKDWGGFYGGFCFTTNELEHQGHGAYYWSQSESGEYGLSLIFFPDGSIDPQSRNVKTHGFSLRCVRDN